LGIAAAWLAQSDVAGWEHNAGAWDDTSDAVELDEDATTPEPELEAPSLDDMVGGI
jgi:hypothetical protein